MCKLWASLRSWFLPRRKGAYALGGLIQTGDRTPKLEGWPGPLKGLLSQLEVLGKNRQVKLHPHSLCGAHGPFSLSSQPGPALNSKTQQNATPLLPPTVGTSFLLTLEREQDGS